jgi:SAM-dependent methyltransferase
LHPSATQNIQLFYQTYHSPSAPAEPQILEIGSRDVNGSLRQYAPAQARYCGADFSPGPGVDLVLSDPYTLPLESNSFDYAVTSSCFEHAEFFWLTFLEISRVLRPGGLFYLNAPSSGGYHCYPVDCWRFYPDAGVALQNWARRQSFNITLLESFVHRGGDWQDFVGVFFKGGASLQPPSARMLDSKTDFENGLLPLQSQNKINLQEFTQDQRRINGLQQALSLQGASNEGL